jgi:polyisoprenoid-binding protein YceI
MTMKRMIGVAVLVAALAPTAGLASTWEIDPAHSRASFSIKHLVISTVRGDFGKTTGKVVIDDADISRSSAEANVDVSTVDTRVPPRDADLRSSNFFDVAKYPTMTFKSTKVERAGDGKLKVTGDLTLHGVTKHVVLDVEGPTPEIKGMRGEARRGVSATTMLNRKDFGLTWNKMIEAGPVVGDSVNVEVSVELVKAASQPEAKK